MATSKVGTSPRARKQTPAKTLDSTRAVTPEVDAPKVETQPETPVAAALPTPAQSSPKPADPNALRLTGKQMRSGMYALQCGDKYLSDEVGYGDLTGNLAEAYLDDNWASLKGRGRRLNKLLYPSVFPVPLTTVKLIFTTKGLAMTTKPFDDFPGEDADPATWRRSQLHNMALAQAAEFEERHFEDLSEHTFYLKDSAMWPLLMARYEKELEAELAEDDPETKWDAMRFLAARVFVAGTFYGARAAQDKREDEAEELRMRSARKKSDRKLRKASLEATRRAFRA